MPDVNVYPKLFAESNGLGYVRGINFIDITPDPSPVVNWLYTKAGVLYFAGAPVSTSPTLWQLEGGTGPNIYYTAGDVGIGLNNPSYPLHVEGNAKFDDNIIVANDKFYYLQDTIGGLTASISKNTSNDLIISNSTVDKNISLTAAGTGSVVVNRLTSNDSISILSSPTYHTIITASGQIADINYTLPSAQGGSNTYLKNDGAGILSWVSAASLLIFSTGLTNNAGTITANLSTGILGGQSVIGGTGIGNLIFTRVIAGDYSAYGLRSDGSVWGSGYNDHGELGDETRTNKSSPVSIHGAHSFNTVDSGYAHVLGFKSVNGSCWSWGRNVYGQLGNLTTTSYSSPIMVAGNHSFVSISCGSFNSSGLKNDGSVWMWGYGVSGNLGDEQISTNRSSPVSVHGNHSFISVSFGYNHSMGLKTNGIAWGWGDNTQGQLGDETTISKSSPIYIHGNHSFISISGGRYHSMGLKSNGSIWAWGDNLYGELGDETATNKSSPISIHGGHSFVSISGGSFYSLGLKSDGSVWAWGGNDHGELGDETITGKSSPISVHGNHSFISIKSNINDGYYSIGLKNNGTAWGWGNNSNGQFGNNNTTSVSSPVIIFNVLTNNNLTLSSTTDSIKGLIIFGNSVYNEANNRMGIGTQTPSASLEIVGDSKFLGSVSILEGGTNPSYFTNIIGGDQITDINYTLPSAQGGSNTYLKNDGAGILSWVQSSSLFTFSTGLTNNTGTITANLSTGISGEQTVIGGTGVGYFVPCPFVRTLAGFVVSYGLKSDGSVWSTGDNTYGQLGNETITGKSSPISVHGAHSFVNVISGDYHALGLKSDGSTWAWGYNTYGELGDETLTNRSSPISVHGAHSFISVSSDSYHSIGLKNDGSVWTWGDNEYGELGDRTIDSKSSPISVHGAHSFISVICGKGFSAGLKNDGSTWTWGYNSYGELGDETTNSKSSPVSVHGEHSFVSIVKNGFHFISLKSDGSAWIWGLNTYGQLGDQTITSKSSPISLHGAHSFIAVSAGDNHSLGLKSNGSVWAWGYNGDGELGDETLTNRSSPILIHSSHSFVNISGGSNHSIALKNDGVAWGWGSNSSGQFGNNNTTSVSSPVIIFNSEINNLILSSTTNSTKGNIIFGSVSGLYWDENLSILNFNTDTNLYRSSADTLKTDDSLIISNNLLLQQTGGSNLLTIKPASLAANRIYTIPDAGAAANFIISPSTPAQGDVLYYNGTTWVSLVAGISGKFLKTLGASSNPMWDTASGYQLLWIPAGGGISSNTAGALISDREFSTNKVNVDVAEFSPAIDQYFEFFVTFDDNWDKSTIKAKFYWTFETAISASTGPTWRIEATTKSDNEFLDAVWGTAVTVYDDGQTANYLHISSATAAVTIGGSYTTGNMINFRVSRDTTQVNNMSAIALLLGVFVQYNTSGGGNAAW